MIHLSAIRKPHIFANRAVSAFLHEDADIVYAHWVNTGFVEDIVDGTAFIIDYINTHSIRGAITNIQHTEILQPNGLPKISKQATELVDQSCLTHQAIVLPTGIYSRAIADAIFSLYQNILNKDFTDVKLAESWLINALAENTDCKVD